MNTSREENCKQNLYFIELVFLPGLQSKYSHETQAISSSDQGPPCSTKDHHHKGPGGQGEGVQG